MKKKVKKESFGLPGAGKSGHLEGRDKMEKKKWVIWSGEGEKGHKDIKMATITGIKRILTRERCGGDRWAYAATYTGNDLLDCCGEVKTRYLNSDIS